MSHSPQTALGRLARKWRTWSGRLRNMMAHHCCGSAKATRMAQDIAFNETDFRALAGRWPESSGLLSQRVKQINLDAYEITRDRPEVSRDLQRTCSLCASQKRCRHDLASDPFAPRWREYCPNAPMFAAWMSEHSKRSKAGQ
jgi:hypothetical protein